MERIRYWVDDSVAMLKLQGKSRLFTKPPESYTEHSKGKTPIVLIPGYLERWGVLRKIGNAVSKREHDVYVVSELGDNRFDIETSAGMVERVIRQNSLNEAVLISHSKGGLIGKQVLIDGFAEKMITIATPFSGSDMATYITNYLPFYSLHELTPQSSYVKKLMENCDVNNRIISIYGEFDNLIPNGCWLDGAENFRCHTKGHHVILNNKYVIKFIKERLDIWEAERKKK